MNLATWLPHARPVSVKGDSVLLYLRSDQDLAKNIIEKTSNRAMIEAALQQVTENVSTFRVEFQPDEVASTPTASVVSSHGLPISETVNLADGKEALADPNIAKVIDVFRGTIVDIQ